MKRKIKNSVIDSIVRMADMVLPTGSSIILFGSQARGDARKDSDWDILILANNERLSLSQKGDLAFPFVELGWNLNEEINPIVHTYKEWEENRNLLFYNFIKSEGIRIWH